MEPINTMKTNPTSIVISDTIKTKLIVFWQKWRTRSRVGKYALATETEAATFGIECDESITPSGSILAATPDSGSSEIAYCSACLIASSRAMMAVYIRWRYSPKKVMPKIDERVRK